MWAPLTHDCWSWRSPVAERKYSTCQCCVKHQFWNYQVISSLQGCFCGFQEICSIVLKEIGNVRLVSLRFGLLSNSLYVSFIGCPFVYTKQKYSFCLESIFLYVILIRLDNFISSCCLHFPRIVTFAFIASFIHIQVFLMAINTL
jgi:hypothetical protein